MANFVNKIKNESVVYSQINFCCYVNHFDHKKNENSSLLFSILFYSIRLNSRVFFILIRALMREREQERERTAENEY
jgi:hypothetical protein